MRHRKKLFSLKEIYNLPASESLFFKAMRKNVRFHLRHCPEYKALLEELGFSLSMLKKPEDLAKIPPLPTSYLKNHSLVSKPYERLLIKTTTSGTSGNPTQSGFDVSSALCGLKMLLRVFKYHGLLSMRRTNYIVLGYQPDKSNKTAMAKALKGVSYLAPPKELAYALTVKNGEYELNTQGIVDALLKFSKQNRPVRIIGFPAYFKLFLEELDERGIRLKLHSKSKVLLGGGWKSFFAEEISKQELFDKANKILGIAQESFKDHFSTAEHPINYVDCKHHHFHIPVFSRVIIRDTDTLEPVPAGTPGLLNLISPLLSSVPYGSILTDDIAVLHEGNDCGCGIASPYFELLGRVGLSSIKTCTQAASEYLNKI
ncbi:MAG: acyl-protein synthetase [Oscillospiraceae bacterium]|jgi:phenylacetate-coenzyme A ligase PaaK-like adenylate-forming protein|nr:acyl-protein synthetase [Oscillospiraceae bacterium]